MKLKYVIFDEMMPALLSELQQHGDFRNVAKATSAGFCSIREVDAPPTSVSLKRMEVTCWGESLSLKLKSDPEHDKWLIERMFNHD